MSSHSSHLAGGGRLTERLRLEPIDSRHAEDLWRLHRDESIAFWYGGVWSRAEAERRAHEYGRGWERDGVSKWIAYDRVTDELIGRGGLTLRDFDGQMRLELGWVVHAQLWGRGYATEIGRAGLNFGFEQLEAEEIVSFTERHNLRSRAVMERLGMRYLREIYAEGLIEGLEGVHPNAPFALYSIARPTR